MSRNIMDKGSARQKASRLLADLSIKEKVGQVNQRLYGFNSYEKSVDVDGRETVTLSQDLIEEVDRFGGLGVLYGLYRSDPWSSKDFETGIRGRQAIETYNAIQAYVMEASPHKIPMLLSSECPHGHQALDGYILPVNLAMGASFNPDLLGAAYKVCGQQMAEMGVDFGLISLLDILRDPRWGRSEECFSEDPYLASAMAKAVVKAVQDQGVLVVAKHMCAQGEGTGGVNASAARIGERELREIHLPALEACCQMGVQGVMAAYNEIDGIPCHINDWLMKQVLRTEYGFDGVIMADGTAIDRLDVMTGDNAESGALALRSGIDISLWDTGFSHLEEAIAQDPSLEADLDRACLEVLTLKYQLGLFEQPFIQGNQSLTTFDYDSYEETLDLARQSVVLLENKNKQLPLQANHYKQIALIGPNAHNIYHQIGDYSPYIDEDQAYTLLRGIQACAGSSQVVYHEGCSLLGADTDQDQIEAACAVAKASDVAVVVLGGSSSRFGQVTFDINGAAIADGPVTMDCGEGVDTAALSLPGQQLELLKALKATGRKVVTIIIAGRPYEMDDVAAYSDALLYAFYPGPMGGKAIGEILFGQVNPSGCLPATLPTTGGQLPVYYNHKSSYDAMAYYNLRGGPTYGFGYGLTYTSFDFVQTDIGLGQGTDALVVTCQIKNTGTYDGYVTPQVYVRQKRSSTIRRVKALKAFSKVWVKAGETVTVTMAVKKKDLEIFDRQMNRVFESSPYKVWVQEGAGQVFSKTIQLDA